MTPRGIRNNNPGNIEYHASIPWQGQTGSDGRFATFDTAHNGIRALAKQLIIYEDKYGLWTVRGIINRWAPPVENNTSAYVNAVAKVVGVDPDDIISTHGKETLTRLVKAIIQHENGQQPYSDEVISWAVRDAGAVPDNVGVHKPPVDPVAPESNRKAGMDPITLSLVGSLISMFAPKLGTQVGKIIGSPEGQPLLNTILSIAKTETGQASDKAALVMAAESPAVVAKIESAADDWLDKMAPALDRIAALEAADFAATEKSKDAAQARWVGQDFDPAPMLTYFSLATVGLLTLFLCVWISIQLLYEKGVGVEMWAALTGMIGWITAKAGSIYDNRFGTTRQSAAKDVVISEMAARR